MTFNPATVKRLEGQELHMCPHEFSKIKDILEEAHGKIWEDAAATAIAKYLKVPTRPESPYIVKVVPCVMTSLEPWGKPDKKECVSIVRGFYP